ncbi:MAG TPA: hypothetical protein VGC91_16615 [Pyrinomonadaceae bacterium]|jgi:hypothetical protein
MKFFKPACAQEIEVTCAPGYRRNRLVLFVSIILWATLVSAGLSALWGYENAPGEVAESPVLWPADSQIQRAPNGATLVMLAHPHCPCTRASIGELASLMAHCQGRLKAYVLFLKPAGFSDDWEKTDLWQSAASIPGVTAVIDDGGVEARRFHAATSGQTVLYDADGRLVFSGGITGSRGHSGDNAGRSAIISLVNVGAAEQSETFVFGCPLFDKNSECRNSNDERNKD